MLTRAYQGDPYAALGLKEGASAASIRAAFRMQARVLHPDVSDDPMSAAKFCALCAAVEALQSGAAFTKVARAANIDVPPGLSDDERVRWLIAKNKVLLFMFGTKQKPLCDYSASMVATLSWVAFDTDTHFTAINVAVDAPLGEAALRVAGMAGMAGGGASSTAVLPLCFIDGTLIGSSDEVDELYESGELMRAFGGEMLVGYMRRNPNPNPYPNPHPNPNPNPNRNPRWNPGSSSGPERACSRRTARRGVRLARMGVRLAGARIVTSSREISSGAPSTPCNPATLCTRPAALCAQAAAPSIHVITCYLPATKVRRAL